MSAPVGRVVRLAQSLRPLMLVPSEKLATIADPVLTASRSGDHHTQGSAGVNSCLGKGWDGFDSEEVESEVTYPVQETMELALVERLGDETGLAALRFDRGAGERCDDRAPRRPWTVTVYRLDCIVHPKGRSVLKDDGPPDRGE